MKVITDLLTVGNKNVKVLQYKGAVSSVVQKGEEGEVTKATDDAIVVEMSGDHKDLVLEVKRGAWGRHFAPASGGSSKKVLLKAKYEVVFAKEKGVTLLSAPSTKSMPKGTEGKVQKKDEKTVTADFKVKVDEKSTIRTWVRLEMTVDACVRLMDVK